MSTENTEYTFDLNYQIAEIHRKNRNVILAGVISGLIIFGPLAWIALR